MQSNFFMAIKRTRDKSGCLVYHSEKEAQKLADKIGGRVKKIE